MLDKTKPWRKDVSLTLKCIRTKYGSFTKGLKGYHCDYNVVKGHENTMPVLEHAFVCNESEVVDGSSSTSEVLAALVHRGGGSRSREQP